MPIEIKIEEMPDALHEFILIAVKGSDQKDRAEILATADKVLAVTSGSIKQWPCEGLPDNGTVISYLVPCGPNDRLAGWRAASEVYDALCKTWPWPICLPVQRIVIFG